MRTPMATARIDLQADLAKLWAPTPTMSRSNRNAVTRSFLKGLITSWAGWVHPLLKLNNKGPYLCFSLKLFLALFCFESGRFECEPVHPRVLA